MLTPRPARGFAGGCILFVLWAVACIPAWAAGNWPTFRADIARTGRARQPCSPELSVLWSCELGGSVDGSPIVVDGRVFVGTSRGRFACVSQDGRLLWSRQLEGAVCSAAAAGGDRLVVGTARGFFYCLGLADGRVLWRAHCWDAVVGSPLVLGGRCYWGSMDGVFHAADLANGQEVWTRRLAGGVSAAACSDGERIFVADEGGRLWALSARDGRVLWAAETSCPAMAAPVLREAVLVVPLVSPTRLAPPKVPFLQAFDARSGKLLWRVVEARSIFASPVFGPTGVAYISVEGYLSATFLRCRSLDGRRAIYKRPIGAVVDSSPAIAGQVAYFGAHDGNVYAVDVASGRVLALRHLAPKIFSSPALVEGRLYIGASDGRLYCLK